MLIFEGVEVRPPSSTWCEVEDICNILTIRSDSHEGILGDSNSLRVQLCDSKAIVTDFGWDAIHLIPSSFKEEPIGVRFDHQVFRGVIRESDIRHANSQHHVMTEGVDQVSQGFPRFPYIVVRAILDVIKATDLAVVEGPRHKGE